MRDITDRKNIESELIKAKEEAEDNENQQKALIDNAIYPITITTIYGKVVYLNKAALNFFDLDEETDLATLNPLDYWVQPEKRKIFSDKIIKSGFAINYEAEFISTDIILKTVLLSSSIIKYGGESALFSIYNDITKQKELDLSLIAAKEKAEESDRLKSAFLANMSHEIRTPMNGILGFSSLLSEPGLNSEEQQAYIELIQKSGARMLNILSEIVEISRIESGAVDLQIKQVTINKKMESVYELLKPEAKAKSINFYFKNSLHLTESVLNTDEGKLDSILTNLIKNAIKYTDEGSVEFGYKLKEIDGRNFLEFYVKDTGIGIRRERQEAIFDRFIQADIEDLEARQGAGLGLAIVKSFVELLDGKVWVESEIGKGSTFYFTLPYRAESQVKIVDQNNLPATKIPRQANPGLSALKILIADDDEPTLKYLSTIIKNISKKVLVASSGLEAVKICQNNSDIHLILMDIRIPEINGYEATQQIKEFNKDVIIVAQTAFAMAGDREKSIAAGCNDYISKPIEKDELLALIQKYFTNEYLQTIN